MNDPYPYAHAPAPSRHPTAPAALRRPHAAQPPSLLITALDNTRNPSLGVGSVTQTPLSSTSLSSPFAAHSQSAFPHSPAGTMRAALSQNFRSYANVQNSYNPQQWGPMSSTASPQSLHPSTSTHRFHTGQTYGSQPVGPDGKGISPMRMSPGPSNRAIQSPLPRPLRRTLPVENMSRRRLLAIRWTSLLRPTAHLQRRTLRTSQLPSVLP